MANENSAIGSPAGVDTPRPSLSDALEDLAARCGVATSYTGQDGSPQSVSAETVTLVLRELGVDVAADATAEECRRVIAEIEEERIRRGLPPTVVLTAGEPGRVQAYAPVTPEGRAGRSGGVVGAGVSPEAPATAVAARVVCDGGDDVDCRVRFSSPPADAGGQNPTPPSSPSPAPEAAAESQPELSPEPAPPAFAEALPIDLPAGWRSLIVDVPPLAPGWHRLQLRAAIPGTSPDGDQFTAEATVICAPARLSSAEKFLDTPAVGVMAQLYSVRDRGAWGVGDYGTLNALGDALAALASPTPDAGQVGELAQDGSGADFVLVNPMHAAQPTPPVEDSPYLPTTRRFTNPLYIRVEDTPEYAAHPELHAEISALASELQARNTSPQELDRNATLTAKLTALGMLWERGLSAEREEELAAYRRTEGPGLEAFADWCTRYAQTRSTESADPGDSKTGADGVRPGGTSPSVETTASPGSHSAAGATHSPDFYAWLQMLCQEQESAAQRRLRSYMRIGLMADLAVGVHPEGADAHTLAYALAPGASVGAPPDGYNQQGQDWSQPPWHPQRLAELGYRPWRDMLRTILRSAGGIRVDHVLGLFRLWWIPRGRAATEGTYVAYDYEALIGALVLEAERAGAVVVGEDLGTFEPWVQDYLAQRGVMGTSILWFEGDEDGPKPPEKYRRLALTSVTTHDLPPTASYLQGGHIELRDRLGVLTRSAEDEFADDAAWQVKVLTTVAEAGGFAGWECEDYFRSGAVNAELADARHGRDARPGGANGLAALGAGNSAAATGSGILQGLHRFIAITPSALRCISLVDLVGDVRAQNQPGTTSALYPNWCIPLCDSAGRPVLAEDLPSIPLAAAVMDATVHPGR